MRKVLSILLLAVALFWGQAALAANLNELTPGIAKQAGYDPADELTLSRNIGNIISAVLALTGVIFLALTVYAGILWMTAAGNETAVEKAQGIIKMSVIGLVIILAAYSITYFVVRALESRSSAQVGGQSEDASPWDQLGNDLECRFDRCD